MITIRRSAERGHADHGWLDTYHTFSFAGYRDPQWMGFSLLRVLNQDRVAPGQGFGTHGHANMEIVSYVLEGTLEHKDSMGNGSQMRPGDVQLMSAGSGVTHSEFNASAEEGLHFLQMWVIPEREGTAPRYEQRHFPAETRQGVWRTVVGPATHPAVTDGDALTIGQDALLHVALLNDGELATLPLAGGRCAWLHVARGAVTLAGGETLRAGDGASFVEEDRITVTGDGAELVCWELPALLIR